MTEKDGYYVLKKGESQYDGLDLKKPLPARYVRATDKAQRGNILLEALPPRWSGDQTMSGYTRGITGFGKKNVENMTREEKVALIRRFRELRFYIPYQQKLEDGLADALYLSYSMRHLVDVTDPDTSYVIDGTETHPKCVSWAESSDPTFGFFSLTGPSGVGKTTSINTLLSHYPKVLTHPVKDGYMTQIVHLYVTCPGNRSMKGMLEQIGREVDHALGYSSHYFQNKIEKTKGVPEKADRVVELIELFSIGAIIFDEVQLLDFAHTNPSSFNTLLTIQNNTKVAFIVVGTSEARAKMFKEEWVFRRTGASINAEESCSDKKHFEKFIRFLFRYQVFNARVEATDEIVESFYKHTHGIIDYVIQLYTHMSLYYIDRKKKPEVNGEYIAFIAKKYFPHLAQLLKKHDYDAVSKLMAEDKHDVEAFFNEPKKAEQNKQIEERLESVVSERLLFDNVTANLMDCDSGYSKSQIEAAFKRVKSAAGAMPEEKMTTMVALDLAKNAKKPKKPKVPAIDTSTIVDMRNNEKEPVTQ